MVSSVGLATLLPLRFGIVATPFPAVTTATAVAAVAAAAAAIAIAAVAAAAIAIAAIAIDVSTARRPPPAALACERRHKLQLSKSTHAQPLVAKALVDCRRKGRLCQSSELPEAAPRWHREQSRAEGPQRGTERPSARWA